MKKAGSDGPDVGLFRCTAHIIREERNQTVHMASGINPPRGMSWGDDRHGHDWEEAFFGVARRSGRRDLLVGMDWSEGGVVFRGGWVLFLMRLMLTTRHRLLDCRKMAKTAASVKR